MRFLAFSAGLGTNVLKLISFLQIKCTLFIIIFSYSASKFNRFLLFLLYFSQLQGYILDQTSPENKKKANQHNYNV